MRHRVAVLAVVVGVGSLLACGGGGGGGGNPNGPRVLSVGGDYAMTVALTSNDCGAVTVLPLPTRVDHTPGAARFRLTHGPNTFDGSVSADGTFTTDQATLSDGSTIVIAGRFSASGLEATATVNHPAPCRYVVRWTGAKQGTPNVIP
jgi:hypothetical protein